MATTSPDNIWTPDSGDDYALTVDLARMADDVQDALNRTQRVRTGTGDPSGVASEGDGWFSTTNRYFWRYIDGAWRLWDTPTVPLTSLAMNWSAALAPNAPYIYARGGRAFTGGGVIFGSGANVGDMLTVPAAFRPGAAGVHWVGTTMGPTSNPFVGGIGVSNTGTLSLTRLTLTPVAGVSLALTANWRIGSY